jgi:hypothetical protein
MISPVYLAKLIEANWAKTADRLTAQVSQMPTVENTTTEAGRAA